MYFKPPATYPYTDAQLRRDNPDTSFPTTLNDAVRAEFEVYPVALVPQPAFDPVTHTVDELLPEMVDEVWTQQWVVRAMTQDELDAYAAQQAAVAQAAADGAATAAARADALVQYLVTHTPAEIADKVAADVTSLAAARTYIAKLAIAVSVLARETLR